MPRPVWSGTISFGLVAIPIKLYNGVNKKSVSFNQLDDRTMSRIKLKKVSAESGDDEGWQAFAAGVRKRLQTEHDKDWRGDEAALWLGATYALLHDDRAARALVEDARFGVAIPPDWSHYRDGLVHDSLLLYLLSRHFPERARRVTPEDLNAIAQPIFNGSYNTLNFGIHRPGFSGNFGFVIR